METRFAIEEYLQIVPQSHAMLRGCIGKPFRQIIWHGIPGVDRYGRLLETLELRFAATSIFLRTPRHERLWDGLRVEAIEFVFPELPYCEDPKPYGVVSDCMETAWRPCIDLEVREIELLVDAKDDRFASYYGIRFQLANEHSLGYHYQWGNAVGEWIDRHPKIVVDGRDPSPELG